MSDVKLLPCPFCGGAPKIVTFDGWWYVECAECHGQGCDTVEGAAVEWNKRTDAAARERRIDRLVTLAAAHIAGGRAYGSYVDVHTSLREARATLAAIEAGEGGK